MTEMVSSSSMRGKGETELRQRLTGHEVGNDGHSQGEAYGPPRHFPTLHVGIGTSFLRVKMTRYRGFFVRSKLVM